MRGRAIQPLVALALVAVLLPGCRAAEDRSAQLSANPWVVTQLQTPEGVQPVLQGTKPAIFFNADGTVSGNSTVNSFKGPYTVTGSAMHIGPLVTSSWTGQQMESAQDQIVLGALRATAQYHVKNGILQLSDESDNLLLGMEVAAAPKLVGPVWTCSAYASESGKLASVIGTSQVVAEFAPDGTLAGAGGVNQYSAPYSVTGPKMTIGPDITSTKVAGPEPLMAQEAAYLAAIAQTASHTISEYRLTLFDASGKTLAEYTPLAPKN
jgi:heat shock protein HslJ